MITLVVVLLCLAVNGWLAAVEMAFITVSKARLRERVRSESTAASRILKLRERPERTLSVIQVGITLVGAIAAAVGGVGATERLSPWIASMFTLSKGTSEATAIVLVVLPITYLSVVAGELVPKAFALRNPLWIALRSARALTELDRVLSPVISALESSTHAVLKLLTRAGRARGASSPMPGGEGQETVELDTLSAPTRDYVLKMIALENRRVRDVALTWEAVVRLDFNLPFDEAERIIIASRHTRLPVTDENGRVLGLLNAKEFHAMRAAGQTDWTSIVRSAPTTTPLDSLLRALRMMQEKRSHLSVVHSPGGQIPVGIVTMEDILEEVIGDVFDEVDDGALRRLLNARTDGRASGSKGPITRPAPPREGQDRPASWS